MGFAVAGGIFLCLGNLGTQYALAYTNLSLTEVVSSSLTVVGGTVLNYFLDDRWEHPFILTITIVSPYMPTCLSKDSMLPSQDQQRSRVVSWCGVLSDCSHHRSLFACLQHR